MGNVHVHSVRFCEECPFERTKNGPNDRGGRRGRSGRGDQGDRALVVGGRLITTKRDSGWGPYDHGSMVREWTMKYRLVKDPRKLARRWMSQETSPNGALNRRNYGRPENPHPDEFLVKIRKYQFAILCLVRESGVMGNRSRSVARVAVVNANDLNSVGEWTKDALVEVIKVISPEWLVNTKTTKTDIFEVYEPIPHADLLETARNYEWSDAPIRRVRI